MKRNFKNNARNKLLDIIKDEFENEINEGIILINQAGDIPVDYDESNDEKIVFYVRKIAGSFDVNATKKNQDFIIGVRSTSKHTNDIADAEDLIYRLWDRFTLFLECDGIFTLQGQYYLLTKDELDRYFYEFNVSVKTIN